LNRRDVVSGLFGLGISIFVGVKAIELGIGRFSAPGPGFVLFCSSLLFGILSVVLVLRSFTGKKGGVLLSAPFRGLKWGRALTVMAAIFVYTCFLERIGFLLMTFGLVAVLFALGKVKPWVSITGAVVTVMLAYVLFHFGLQVQFPRGIVAW
jgi:Tripartite tricarboxylate transporter TctB family